MVPKGVTIVRFHPSIIEVEDRAFIYCKQLIEVVFNDGLQKIGIGAFQECSSLSSITLPSTVTEIGEYAFYRCSNLKFVEFNEGLQKIGRNAFCDCTSLSSITIPSTVTEVEYEAFRDCNNLREVTFNDGLRMIRSCAFYRCSSLPSITFPSTVVEIRVMAFNHCNNLREVVLHGVPRKVWQNAFSSCTSLERFAFPTISTRLDNLIQTGHWDDIENEVNEGRGVVERSGGDVFVSTDTMDRGRNWNRVRENLDKTVRLISYYELKEATPMLELALWKFKLDQVDAANPIPRKQCRMDAPGQGSAPVRNP